MIEKLGKTNSNITPSFIVILYLQLILYLTVFLNVPIARQIIGFFYLTFVPGYVTLKLFKQNGLGIAETVLFSTGLSIAFVMLMGLVMNTLGPLMGLQHPLTSEPLIIMSSSFVLAGTVFVFLRNRRDHSNVIDGFPVRHLILFVLPVTSLVGAIFVNETGNPSILLFVILATAVLFAVAVFSERLIPRRIHLIVVFAIALTLIAHYSMISPYLNGVSDIQFEYSVFSLTLKNGYWNSTAYSVSATYGTYNNMLSLTVLPTVYSNMLSLDATQVLRMIFPVIFALVPLALYLIWREKFGATTALFSAFLLMSQITFYTEVVDLARQMIAELFFVLLFVVLFSKKISPINRKVLFVIFGFSLVVSHYSMALIFLFFIIVIWLFAYFKRTSTTLTMSMIALFFSLMFMWYIFTSTSTSFETILSFANSIYTGLGDFFIPASRGTGVLQGIGLQQAQSTLQQLSRGIAYATELFIAIGFLAIIVRRKKESLDFDYFSLCSASMIILALCILLPNFALSLQITRFYHILLFFLAPLFSIGCTAFVESITKSKKKLFSVIFITVLLIAYFLFQINFVYEVAGSKSWSLSLSGYRLGSRLYTEFAYVTQPQVFSAEWLSQHANIGNVNVHADTSAFPILISYGSIYRERLQALTNITSPSYGDFVYLDELNTVYGIVSGTTGGNVWNTSQTVGLQSLSATYTNGYCEIYKNTTIIP